MADLFYSKKFIVNPLMVDLNRRLFPAEIFRLMQITADEHVRLLGFGEEIMSAKSLAWVLTRSCVKMDEYPVLTDEITVFTQTCEQHHGVYPRTFEFRNADGNVIGKASTIWIVFDMEKRAMVSEKESGIVVPGHTGTLTRSELPGTARRPKDGKVTLSERTVVYSDLDMVGHMNNTRYIDWLCDAFSPERYKNAFLSEILINYISETPAGTTLELELTENGNDFSFCDLSSPKKHFEISGKWKEMKPL